MKILRKDQLCFILLLLNALVYLAFGPAFVFWPESFAALLGINLTSPTALADFRAMYGGLPFGVGFLFVGALYRKIWVTPALVVIAATSGSLMCSRIYSAVVDGDPKLVIWVFVVMELQSLVLALWILKDQTAETKKVHPEVDLVS